MPNQGASAAPWTTTQSLVLIAQRARSRTNTRDHRIEHCVAAPHLPNSRNLTR